MKEIPLTEGKVALCDDEDFATLSTRKWYTHVRYPRSQRVFMHNVLMPPPSGLVVDHINGNGFDNRRSNLRLVSAKDNSKNRAGQRRGFKGVVEQHGRNPFSAAIRVDGVPIFLGRWATELDAARAYDKAARFYFGEYARLNFPDEDIEPSPPILPPPPKTDAGIYYRGVKWRPQLNVGGRTVYLGGFETKEEAIAARVAKLRELGRME